MRETGVYSNYKCACFHLRCCEAVCIQRVIQWMSVWNTMKDVFIIWLPCPCFGAVVFFLDKNCENVKCTLKFKGRPEALRLLYMSSSIKSSVYSVLPGVQRSSHWRAEHESETFSE